MNKMTLSKNKEKTIKEYARHDKDSGSTEVQIALLTKKIDELAQHLKTHRKDQHSRRGLLIAVGQRRRFIQYLKRTNKAAYQKISPVVKL